jgi:hypothetical protein
LDNETAVPPAQGVRCSDSREAFEQFGFDGMCQDCQTSPLGIRQLKSFTLELRLQDPILLTEVTDDIVLVSIDPTRQPSNQKW